MSKGSTCYSGPKPRVTLELPSGPPWAWPVHSVATHCFAQPQPPPLSSRQVSSHSQRHHVILLLRTTKRLPLFPPTQHFDFQTYFLTPGPLHIQLLLI